MAEKEIKKAEAALRKKAEKAAAIRLKDGTLKLADKVSYIRGYMRQQSST